MSGAWRGLCGGWVLLLTRICGATLGGQDLPNLPDKPESPRFPLTDRVWPTTYGDAVVCLWAHDKMAAAGVTIDDNVVSEHDWWVEQMARRGWKMTWFVITDFIYTNPDYNGTWADFARLHALGHSIQSHTVHHYEYDNTQSDALMREEYAFSREEIETHIPGARCLTLAYPFGEGKPSLAAETFIAARGVGADGDPGPANQTTYMNTLLGDPTEESVDKMLTPGTRHWRGFIAPLYHDVYRDQPASEQEILKLQCTLFLDYVKAREREIWFDTYMHLMQYGQERDTHQLTVLARDPGQIRLRLTDQMRDSLFDYPLTVKVCLGAAWNGGLAAAQGGAPIPARLELHEGLFYAMVEAVPDRGEVVLTPTAARVRVLAPNGCERLRIGASLPISWSAQGVAGSVRIEVHRAEGKVLDVATLPASQGATSWVLPAQLEPASDYRIRVVGEGCEDRSNDPFIVLAADHDETPPTAPRNLHVLEESSGQVILTWDSASDNRRVVGYLTERNGAWIRLGAVSEALRQLQYKRNDGDVFRVYAVDEAGNVGPGSNPVTVGGSPPARLQLESPNGGERWRRGEEREITWTAEGDLGELVIEVLQGQTVLGTIASSVPASAGRFSWTVGLLNDGTWVSGAGLVLRLSTLDGRFAAERCLR